MCSCVQYVIVLCQPQLCNSCIKEKLTPAVQIITGGQSETGRLTDRWTQRQTLKGDQLVPSSGSTCLCNSACVCMLLIFFFFNSMPVLCRGGSCLNTLFPIFVYLVLAVMSWLFPVFLFFLPALCPTVFTFFFSFMSCVKHYA